MRWKQYVSIRIRGASNGSIDVVLDFIVPSVDIFEMNVPLSL